MNEHQLQQARINGQSGFKVTEVKYDPLINVIVLDFSGMARFIFSVSMAEGLANAEPWQLAEVEISPSGLGLHWPSLDVDLSVPDLLQGVFGTELWMAQLGRKGGSSTSVAKQNAARQNGKKGGRPKKS